MMRKIGYLLTACLLLIPPVYAADASTGIVYPEDDSYIHHGVASCASSVCHGKTVAVEGENVGLNEYKIWNSEDSHSQAYKTLFSEASKKIAKNLGLASAHTDKSCLDCHAENIDIARRGQKFQLTDGIGCEGCHGGSEQWLKYHTDSRATHRENLEKGMYPTEDPFARASLCLSCHLGNSEKFADHAMMAAGHPRLAFELGTFMINQPAHFTIDEDYIKRKGDISTGQLWVAGQIESADMLSQLLLKHATQINARSLAVYDCHSCHHPMQPVRGKPNDASQGLPSGSLRVQDFSYDMVNLIFSVVMPKQQATWYSRMQAMHKAISSLDQPGLSSVMGAMAGQLKILKQALRQHPSTNTQLDNMRQLLVQRAAQGSFSDYSSAEQVFMAIESFSYTLGDHAKLSPQLDKIYASLGNEHTYNPRLFEQAVAALEPYL